MSKGRGGDREYDMKKERRVSSIQQVSLMAINTKIRKAHTGRRIRDQHDRILGILNQVGEMDIENSKEISSLRSTCSAQLYPATTVQRRTSSKYSSDELSRLIERSNGLFRSSDLRDFVRSIVLACSVQSAFKDDDNVFRGPLKRFEFVSRHEGCITDVLQYHDLIRSEIKKTEFKTFQVMKKKFNRAKYDIVEAICKSDCDFAGELTDRAVDVFMKSPFRCYVETSSETGIKIEETLDMFRMVYDQTNVSDVEFWNVVLRNHFSRNDDDDDDDDDMRVDKKVHETMLSSLGISMIDGGDHGCDHGTTRTRFSDPTLSFGGTNSMTMSKIQQKFEAEQKKTARWKI